MTILIFCIVTITDSAFSNSLANEELSQTNQLSLIGQATGDDLSKSNIANWNVYNNVKYGFSLKYPETLAQSEDGSKKTYSEEYSDSSVRPLKIIFEYFAVKIWDNSGDLELKKYLAGDEVCALEEAFCRKYKILNEIPLAGTTVAGKDWFQTKDRSQRFFIPSPDNKYFIDLELANSKKKKDFAKIIGTLEFTDAAGY